MIATNLKRLRLQKKLSQEKLGERANLTGRCIGLIESGERKPYLETAVKIAKALEIDINELIIGEQV